MKVILMDIEGTMTSIDFVHKTLFPYSTEKISSFVQENLNLQTVQEALEKVRATLKEEKQIETDLQALIAELLHWIEIDRKHPALKTIQGLLWQKGYEQSEIFGHVYDDVPQAFKKWTQQGLRLAIYSSGSVLAQKLLLKHSVAGDLTCFIEDYFDTSVGHKAELTSYKMIAEKLKVSPTEILFLSDRVEELAAAKAVGYECGHLVREGEVTQGLYTQYTDFSTI